MELPEKTITKVMLVDDHQMFIDGLHSLLNKFKVVSVIATATSGEKALEILKQEDIKLVITDINMPEMSGIELSRIIKNDYPEIKVLVLTMYNEREIINEILLTDAEGYVLKNTGKKELLEAIKKIVDGGTYYCNEVVEIIMENYQQNKKKEIEPINLTPREREILKLTCEEYSCIEIADKLSISPLTVETHRKNIFRKTKAKTIIGLIKYALLNNLHTF